VKNQGVIIGGIVAAGVLLFILGSRQKTGKIQEVDDWQIDPDMGKHRGIAYVSNGTDQIPTRMHSAQDPKGGAADYLGYNYDKSLPSLYAKGEPAVHAGKWWDKREDDWTEIPLSPLDYGPAPGRIPKLFKDANRYWDGITSYGGTEVVAQRMHLFHFRPSAPTRGYRSISGSFSTIGGGQSTGSRIRIPAIFVPSVVS
jgi:hypothetical protein